MSFQSAELKLRNLAQANAALIADLTWPNTAGNPLFMWMDTQLVQGDIGKRSDGKCVVYAHRISEARQAANMGQPNTPLTAIRMQVDIASYDAEQARSVANDMVAFMNSISLCSDGYYKSPATGPSQNPNFLLNTRQGLMPQLSPPPFVVTQDWRIWSREDFPS
jgi:hypothetical protein